MGELFLYLNMLSPQRKGLQQVGPWVALNVDIFTAVHTFICNSHRFDLLLQV